MNSRKWEVNVGVHSFEELSQHVGHRLECVTYGDARDTHNVAIECLDCNEVLLDFDNEELIEDIEPTNKPEFKFIREEENAEQDVHPDEAGDPPQER